MFIDFIYYVLSNLIKSYFNEKSAQLTEAVEYTDCISAEG